MGRYAPVAGTAQQLSVFTVGEVVTTGQRLMIIVPKGTKLEVEAMLLNRDKGFVREPRNGSSLDQPFWPTFCRLHSPEPAKAKR